MLAGQWTEKRWSMISVVNTQITEIMIDLCCCVFCLISVYYSCE
jgi:hypothetical protein